jgi:hypothetical protein
MNAATPVHSEIYAGNSHWPRLAPIFTLVLLAPGIAEVLSGATRLSYIHVFISEVMVWGCGALIVRDIVRRWRAGWPSMLLLGFCLSIAEEFIIQQTSLAPLPWVSSPAYGRIWGVNLIFFIFMLGYESVMVVLVPVQLTELLFPDRRREPWLKKSGLIISVAVFVLGSGIAWFLWTQIARPIVFHVPKYQPPFAAIFSGILMIALLARAAYALRNTGHSSAELPARHRSNSAPPPWIVAIVTLILGFPWYALMVLIFGPKRDIPLWTVAAAAFLWAAFPCFVIQRWASASNWRDTHRCALVSSATLVCMLAGFSGSSSWPHSDIVAKAILNALAVAGFIWLALTINRRPTPTPH